MQGTRFCFLTCVQYDDRFRIIIQVSPGLNIKVVQADVRILFMRKGLAVHTVYRYIYIEQGHFYVHIFHPVMGKTDNHWIQMYWKK